MKETWKSENANDLVSKTTALYIYIYNYKVKLPYVTFLIIYICIGAKENTTTKNNKISVS